MVVSGHIDISKKQRSFCNKAEETMKVDVISDYSSFMKLAHEWNYLAESLTLPFLRHEWTDLCLTTLYPKHTRLNIILARSAGKLRAIAPLIAVYQTGVRHLVMPAAPV
jgi:hypothetical protein